MITDPDFITASDLDESKYKGLTMGKKEGEVMKDLIYKHGFFRRTESIDFQDVCSISPYAPKVWLCLTTKLDFLPHLRFFENFGNLKLTLIWYCGKGYSRGDTEESRGAGQLLQEQGSYSKVLKQLRLHYGRR